MPKYVFVYRIKRARSLPEDAGTPPKGLLQGGDAGNPVFSRSTLGNVGPVGPFFGGLIAHGRYSNAVDLRSRPSGEVMGAQAPAGRGEAWLAALPPRSAVASSTPEANRRGSPCPPRLPPTARNRCASRP